MELQKPAPMAACSIPEKIEQAESGRNVGAVERNNKLFAGLLAHAIACGQTRVFNMNFGTQGLRTPGGVRDWHSLTHEEPIDPKLGYQKDVTWFIEFATRTFAEFLTIAGQLQGRAGLGARSHAGAVADRSWLRAHAYDGRSADSHRGQRQRPAQDRSACGCDRRPDARALV